MYKFNPNIVTVVQRSIEEIGSFDLQPAGTENPDSPPSAYLLAHRHEYIRTVQDLAATLGDAKDKKILEIGAFFGVVSVSLARLGYKVTAADIPEYMDLEVQQRRFASMHVSSIGLRLEDFVLPFEDETFDAIVMCEVLEHLNFNPLPLIKEINRICKTSGVFYLSLPNQASIYNRLSLLRGRSIQVSVQSFFEQLTTHIIVNGHWREYTAADVQEMLGRMGFKIPRHYFFSLGETQPIRSFRALLARSFFEIFPQFKENQTAIAIKHERSTFQFMIPRTVHPTLRKI